MPPTLHKRRRMVEQRPIIGWFDLPFEMREMVIDEMDPTTRCKFAQCSKLCEKEVKGSKNYLHGLALSDIDEESERENVEVLELSLSFEHRQTLRDCWFEFIDARHNVTIVAYRCNKKLFDIRPNVKWTKIETGKPKDVRMRYLNEYLEKYKHCIRCFCHEDREPVFHNFNIKNLKRLQSVYIKNRASKSENLVENGFIDMSQLVHLDKLYTFSVYFTHEQLTEYNGKLAWFTYDKFNEESVKKYLKMRKNGEIHQNLKIIAIRGVDKGVNVENITGELNVFNYSKKNGSWYKFSFHSNIRRNGQFNVEYRTKRGDGTWLEIEWEDVEMSI